MFNYFKAERNEISYRGNPSRPFGTSSFRPYDEVPAAQGLAPGKVLIGLPF